MSGQQRACGDLAACPASKLTAAAPARARDQHKRHCSSCSVSAAAAAASAAAAAAAGSYAPGQLLLAAPQTSPFVGQLPARLQDTATVQPSQHIHLCLLATAETH